jgi:archaemetzincin
MFAPAFPLVLTSLLALALPTPARAESPPPTVVACFQPLGPHDAKLLEGSVQGVQHFFGFDVRVLPALPLPDVAWYPPRKRWRADKILDYLDTAVLPGTGCAFIVGFTSSDISTTKDPHVDWGVFGLGEIEGVSAVVSTRRLAGWPRSDADRQLVRVRTVKVVNHEIGHVLGLPHRGTPGCLMNDAHGTIKTVDAETGALCADSRAWVLTNRGISVPNRDDVDWAAVFVAR